MQGYVKKNIERQQSVQMNVQQIDVKNEQEPLGKSSVGHYD